MKNNYRSAALAVLALASAALPTAQADGDRHGWSCSIATLRGTYVFSATGYNIINNVAQPKSVTLLIRFNGDGTVSAPAATVSLNGTILRPTLLPGTYSIEPDCTGKLQFGPPGPGFDLFVPWHGSFAVMAQTVNPVGQLGPQPGVLEGRATRVGR
jgi:hypothetical protein